MSILVLGLGNILLSDEGVGVRIVEALDAAHELPAEVEVLDGGTSGMDLLDMVAERDCLIVADAINADQPAGNVIRLEDDDIRMLFETRFSPHQLGLSDMLAALRLVGKAPRRVIVVGVVPQNLSLGMELSPPVAQGRDAALGVIVDELTRLGAAPRPRPASRRASACSGEVDTGSPTRTCANERIESVFRFHRTGTRWRSQRVVACASRSRPRWCRATG
ncbi:MAG: HyaD/HybD family hydrogenase maturation endopeptidase [Bacteroidales bacterium]